MLEKALLNITGLLDRHSISYMIIGGYAVVYQGESRFTEDIDITLGVDKSYLDEVLTFLEDDFAIRVENPAEFVGKTNVLPVWDSRNAVKIDLLFSFIEFEREAIKRAETVLIDNRKVQIISAEDLIIYKLIAARARDIEDARLVLEKKGADIDVDFIDKHLQKMSELLGRSDIYKSWEELKAT